MQTHATWYEPLTEQSEIDTAVHWVFSRPGLFLNTAGDIGLLPKVLSAAARFEAAMVTDQLEAEVAQLAMQPLFTWNPVDDNR